MTELEREEGQSRLAWFLWRYRSELKPLWIALGLFLVSIVLHAAWPMSWVVVLVLTFAGCLLVLERGPRFGIDRTIEKEYAIGVLVAAGGWTAAAISYGPFTAPVPGVFMLGVLVCPAPWWWDHRRRSKVQVERGLEKWGEAAKASGLDGSRVQRVTVTRPGVWTAWVLLKKGQTLTEAQAARKKLESALGLRGRSIEMREDPTLARRVVMQVVERDPHAKPLPWPAPVANGSILHPMSLGLYQNGDPVQVVLAYQHTGVAGMQGSGKSVLVNSLVGGLAACTDVVLWGCDLKHGLELGPWEPVFPWLAKTKPEVERLLQAGLQVMEARGQSLERRGLRLWPISSAEPALVIVIDEQAEMAASEVAVAAAETITAQGRALGVFIVTATQYPTVEALGSSIFPQQLSIKVCLRVLDANATNVALGKGKASEGFDAHKLPKHQPGLFYISAPNAEEPRIARAFLVTDAMVTRTVAKFRGHRPTLDAVSAQAAAGRPAPTVPVGAAPEAPPAPPTTPEEFLVGLIAATGPVGARAQDLVAEMHTVHGLSRTATYDLLRGLEAAGTVERHGRGRRRIKATIPPGDAA